MKTKLIQLIILTFNVILFTVLKFIRIGLFITLLLLLIIYIKQREMIYIPKHQNHIARQIKFNAKSYQKPEVWGLRNFEDCYIESFDGILLNAWYFENNNSSKVLIFFHGNAGNIGHRLYEIERLYSKGMSVLIYDYSNYGNSEAGGISESRYKKDAIAIYEHIIKKGTNSKDIFLFGRSLGGAVAISLAHHLGKQNKFGGLIIENTFLSIKEMAIQIFDPFTSASIRNENALFAVISSFLKWFFFFAKIISPILIKDKWESFKSIKEINCPILFLCAENDEIVYPFHMEKLYNVNKSNNKKLVCFPQCNHNNIIEKCPEMYLSEITDFVFNAK